MEIKRLSEPREILTRTYIPEGLPQFLISGAIGMRDHERTVRLAKKHGIPHPQKGSRVITIYTDGTGYFGKHAR